jgi:hypothetical protein
MMLLKGQLILVGPLPPIRGQIPEGVKKTSVFWWQEMVPSIELDKISVFGENSPLFEQVTC